MPEEKDQWQKWRELIEGEAEPEVEEELPAFGTPEFAALLHEFVFSLPRRGANVVLPQGEIPLSDVFGFLISEQGQQWFYRFINGMERTIPITPKLTPMESQVEYYGQRIKDKQFTQNLLRSFGVSDPRYMTEAQKESYLTALRVEATAEEVAPKYAKGAPYQGYTSYEDYARVRSAEIQPKEAQFQAIADKANRGESLSPQEIQILNQGRPSQLSYVAPEKAFPSQVIGGNQQARLAQLIQSEPNWMNIWQRAKELGINTSGIESTDYTNVGGGEGFASDMYALMLETSRREQAAATAESKRAATMYPEEMKKYAAYLATPDKVTGFYPVYQPSGDYGTRTFLNWFKGQPDYAKALAGGEEAIMGKYPAGWGMYQQKIKAEPTTELGWQGFLAQDPIAREYVRQQELEFTQARQQARRRISPTSRWIV